MSALVGTSTRLTAKAVGVVSNGGVGPKPESPFHPTSEQKYYLCVSETRFQLQQTDFFICSPRYVDWRPPSNIKICARASLHIDAS